MSGKLHSPGVAECRDEGTGKPRLSCDGGRILVSQSLLLSPYRAPSPDAARILDQLGALLRQRGDLQLIRIEVRRAGCPKLTPDQARATMDASQRRADALFRQLWRKQGVSAERLEAVGYGCDEALANQDPSWQLLLRVAQRREH